MKAKITEILPAVKEVLVTLFGKQKDNAMLRDMGIEKGFWAQFGYMVWFTFVMPLKILSFLLNPQWAWIRFVSKNLITPAMEIEAFTGDQSPSEMLGGTYEKYLNHLKNTEKTGVNDKNLKPDMGEVERVSQFAKIRVVLTASIFIGVALSVFEEVKLLLEFFDLVGWLVGAIGFVTGGFFGGGVLIWIVTFILGVLVSYLMIFAIKFVLDSITQVVYTDPKIIRDFIDDSLHYTVTKAVELYGEDIAYEAYELLLDNFVCAHTLKVSSVNDQHYLKIEERKKFLKEITGATTENN